MRAALLIPVKNLANAKQRLGEALDQPQRSQLAEAMLRDVMTAAAGVTDRLDVFLVTGDVARDRHGGRVQLRRHRRHPQRKRNRCHRNGDRMVRASSDTTPPSSSPATFP